ncbi:hypothetical protein COD94_04470 [Bacillus cereus]|nr:hypothetical protein COD94_04470 [Bacillus cereus]
MLLYTHINLSAFSKAERFFCCLNVEDIQIIKVVITVEPASKIKNCGVYLKFYEIQLQRLECSMASLLPMRQKTPLRQKLHPLHILNEPLALFKQKRGEHHDLIRKCKENI